MKIKKSVIVDIISMLYIILFLYSGISKLLDYAVFREQLAESSLLAPISSIVAVALPITEIIIALALFVPQWRIIGYYISLALMVVFTIYIISILSLNPTLPCSCGGVLAELSWPQHIVFNSVFIIIGVTGIILERKLRKTSSTEEPPQREYLQIN